MTSRLIPVPVSVTQSEMYWPGVRSRSLAARSSSHLLAVSMVMRPPSGIASRALITRLSRALSSWEVSTLVSHRPPAPTTSTSTAGPTVRRISSSMPATRRFASVGFGSRVWRREKASRRWVSVAARWAECWAMPM